MSSPKCRLLLQLFKNGKKKSRRNTGYESHKNPKTLSPPSDKTFNKELLQEKKGSFMISVIPYVVSSRISSKKKKKTKKFSSHKQLTCKKYLSYIQKIRHFKSEELRYLTWTLFEKERSGKLRRSDVYVFLLL